ncbi:FtsW/RodA/SpoVE family cell cycle protein [Paenibacillus aurantiacus]|uniref:FtsW/RodA/SpoVE family cell cycle protein n=1 Tax=Paenibacillus aurantiacus TaxID=1936118 RepID=A0ABV5KKD6_9BACL
MSVIALVTGLLLIGLISVFALHNAIGEQISPISKLTRVSMGVVALVCLYFIDYRQLLRYATALYVLTLLLMAYPRWADLQISGSYRWITAPGGLEFNIAAAAPYLLIVAVAGMLHRAANEQRSLARWQRLLKEAALYMALPAYLFTVMNARFQLVVYGIALAVLLLVMKRMWLLAAGIGAAIVSAFYMLYERSPRYAYALDRLTGFLNPVADESFYTARSVESVQAGGLWGQGFGAVNERLPYIYSETTFAYLIYSLGWIFGLAVAALAVLFVYRMFRMALKLRFGCGRGMVAGLSAVIGIQLLWHLLMNVGLLPYFGVPLPIVSWSTGSIVELGAIGLMLGAYRRKDMLATLDLPPVRKT